MFKYFVDFASPMSAFNKLFTYFKGMSLNNNKT